MAYYVKVGREDGASLQAKLPASILTKCPPTKCEASLRTVVDLSLKSRVMESPHKPWHVLAARRE